MKTGRVLVNMPSSQGAIGDIYNFKLEPSLTLGCGSWGGNSISENVGVNISSTSRTSRSAAKTCSGSGSRRKSTSSTAACRWP
jgi:acyl-CoA reductase-like NAD-dependent aldehyde dehydrogenase